LPVDPLRVPKPLQLLLLLLQPVRNVSGRVTVAIVVDECRLDDGLAVVGAGRSVVAGWAVLVVVNRGRATDVHSRRRRRRRRRRRSRCLLVLVVAACEYGGRQQPPYALFFGAVVAVRRFRQRGRSGRHRRTHYAVSEVHTLRDRVRSLSNKFFIIYYALYRMISSPDTLRT